ncbi:MAG: aldehyde dehydrogenase family protein [Candidatus Eremiobacteraeota bacterium]|nr:aldehyde dehydrogenase family protein [Candidatus Eremiobacteraeota bacterium]
MQVRPMAIDQAAGTTTVGALDRDVEVLREHARDWARLGFAGKIRHLRTMRARTVEVGVAWAAVAAKAKGIAGTALAGEEWLSGPYGLLIALDRLIATVGEVAQFGGPRLPGTVRTRADGQVVADVFPAQSSDRILLSGVRAETWMAPEVARGTLAAHTASALHAPKPDGYVTLVLGAGNIASIAPLDVLSALYAHGSVVMLKPNPVNAYLTPFFAHVFGALADEGFVRIASGGADVGAYLCSHPGIDAIHLTGGERTHDAIVFGTGPDAAARKAAAQPLLRKTITSELGNVTPVIVVPGPWSAPDLAFQAAHVATMKLHNAGANCIAAQVVVTPQAWPLAERFVDAIRGALAAAPPRPSYYPGADDRRRAVAEAHPTAETFAGPPGGDPRTFVPNLDPARHDESLFTTEAFAPVLAQTALPGDDAASFLRNAVAFCNDVLHGTLGASILIHPRTIAELGPVFDDAVAALRYGSVTINTWPGVGFLLPTASWGAFPGNTLANVGSGIGCVHNALLFDAPEKTVVRAPFAPFPRSLGDGEPALLPTPPWFVTHRHADVVGRRIFAFAANPSPLRLAATALDAMRA